MEPSNLKDELAAQVEVKIYLVQPGRGSQTRAWDLCQRVEVEPIKDRGDDSSSEKEGKPREEQHQPVEEHDYSHGIWLFATAAYLQEFKSSRLGLRQ